MAAFRHFLLGLLSFPFCFFYFFPDLDLSATCVFSFLTFISVFGHRLFHLPKCLRDPAPFFLNSDLSYLFFPFLPFPFLFWPVSLNRFWKSVLGKGPLFVSFSSGRRWIDQIN